MVSFRKQDMRGEAEKLTIPSQASISPLLSHASPPSPRVLWLVGFARLVQQFLRRFGRLGGRSSPARQAQGRCVGYHRRHYYQNHRQAHEKGGGGTFDRGRAVRRRRREPGLNRALSLSLSLSKVLWENVLNSLSVFSSPCGCYRLLRVVVVTAGVPTRMIATPSTGVGVVLRPAMANARTTVAVGPAVERKSKRVGVGHGTGAVTVTSSVSRRRTKPA